MKRLFALACASLALRGSPAPTATTAAAEIETRSTFHCLSLYWTRPAAGTCTVHYRVAGETAWQQAQDLWYDAITESRMMNQYRGSIVNLRPGTAYEIKVQAGGEQRVFTAATWREDFKIKKTLRVGNGATFSTTEGGNAEEGYVLYEGTGATIDQQNLATNLVLINHSHVIVRGFKIINAQHGAVVVGDALTDVVIERCDISNWGSQSQPKINPAWGKIEAGIKCGSTCRRIVIQRNRVHHPRYTSTKWGDNPADRHPRGPRAIFMGHRSDDEDWEANHIIRYNEFFSDRDHLFEDVVGGGLNWSQTGHPGRDSDIYCNVITHSGDDLIEADGGGQNVRIWGNYLAYGFMNVSLQSCTIGPVYIFRNVFGHSMAYLFGKVTDTGFKFRGSGGALEPGQKDYAPFRGRVYVYHNTQLHGEDYKDAYSLGFKDHVRNVISRNNVLTSSRYYLHDMHDSKGSALPKINEQDSQREALKAAAAAKANKPPFNPDFVECSFDYDLCNQDSYGDSIPRVLGQHGIKAQPKWRPGHGPAAGQPGNYQLAADGPGRNAGVALPNFNRGAREEGGAPDIGAHEFDAAPLQFGVEANWSGP